MPVMSNTRRLMTDLEVHECSPQKRHVIASQSASAIVDVIAQRNTEKVPSPTQEEKPDFFGGCNDEPNH